MSAGAKIDALTAEVESTWALEGETSETDTVEARPALVVTSTEGLLEHEFKPREYLLDPWLPTQGTALMFAPRGLGKTYLAISIALAVATGTKLLKWEAPRPRKVLYLDGELPGSVLQQRIAALTNGLKIDPDQLPLRFYTPDMQGCGMLNLAYPKWQAKLDTVLGDTELVVVDHLSALCRFGRENEAESWLPVQDWALRLRRRGTSILFVHHAGKGGQQRGTSRREDIVDTVVSLRRPSGYEQHEGAAFEVHYEKARGFSGDAARPFVAKLVGPEDALAWETVDLEKSKQERVQELIAKGYTQKEAAEELGLSPGYVSKLVNRNG